MLKVRVLPTLLYKGLGLVKGVGFESWRRVGALRQAIRVYDMREVDELVFLDISATAEERSPDFELIDDFADECFMPLAVGGGVRTLEDVRRLLGVGADKVVINTAAVETPELLGQVARRFGSQCLVVSIDVRRRPDGSSEVYTRSGTHGTGLEPVELARRAEAAGAGELLLTSVERDGTMQGYDLELLREIAQTVSVPVIASGGAGTYDHLVEAVRAGASAVAAASMYHFTQCTPFEAKLHMHAAGIPVRLGRDVQ
jgi:cyclase